MACGSSRVEGLLGDEMHKTFGLVNASWPRVQALWALATGVCKSRQHVSTLRTPKPIGVPSLLSGNGAGVELALLSFRAQR